MYRRIQRRWKPVEALDFVPRIPSLRHASEMKSRGGSLPDCSRRLFGIDHLVVYVQAKTNHKHALFTAQTKSPFPAVLHVLPSDPRHLLHTQRTARQRRDCYVKQREFSASHLAFKLLELDIQLNFLDHEDVNVVVDLGAAPGGWSQVISWRAFGVRVRGGQRAITVHPSPESSRPGSDYDPLNIDRMEEEIARSESKGRGAIVAVDLLPMNPIPGVRSLQKDFLDPKTDVAITDLLHSSIPGLRQWKMGKALVDVVLSDMAPNISGNALHDSEK
ncbi:FtsJ-like methyltransferase-domain-containing protein [Desarmillaria tabescens]|uniref:rRNA methyltransferase 2, mitochondrial n=1 Tax=Armillaria tabescens TaxID=1929756 RepID=A0AA39JLR7_ARMTA|nr:FtsJ-like methyltransferase-domain-containing protein [Desarmillaria tabescens]KAK0444983.1 FtsJ-like methyltransferase-domain-containing protein [Desarmillaria tabescens]